MNYADKLEYFKIQLSNNLNKNSSLLQSNLVKVITGEIIPFIENKSLKDVANFNFEYGADSLNIIFWCEDAQNNMLTTNGLRLGKITDDNNFPKNLSLELIELEDEQIEIDEDAFYDFSDTLYQESYQILENWFINIWKDLNLSLPNNTKAFISIHDTIYKKQIL